jgi:phenylalanyl-tRNA synthetase beta subunit
MNRTQAENERIAHELMSGCQKDEEWGEDSRTPWTDHQAIADAILEDLPVDDILAMPEFECWPDTYDWVKNELGE